MTSKVLTPEIAKNIAFDIAPQINKIEDKEYILIHSEKVSKFAKLIGKKVGIETDILEIAGRLHDIGYSKDVKQHAIFSLEIVKNLGYEVDETLEDCILNHGTDKTPTTIQGKIVQIADKMSIFDFDTIELILKYGPFPFNEEDMSLVKKMSENAIKFIENFKP